MALSGLEFYVIANVFLEGGIRPFEHQIEAVVLQNVWPQIPQHAAQGFRGCTGLIQRNAAIALLIWLPFPIRDARLVAPDLVGQLVLGKPSFFAQVFEPVHTVTVWISMSCG